MNKLFLNTRASRLRVPNLAILDFEIRCMPIEQLNLGVRPVPVFVDEVAESIDKSGLFNPVIVVRGPAEDLRAELTRMGYMNQTYLPELPVLNCVFGGTNRVFAAEKLGYTHIDCILLPTFELGLKLQDLQRASYGKGKASQVGSA